MKVRVTEDYEEMSDVAAELALDEVYSELLPGDKVAKVEELLDREKIKPGDRISFQVDYKNILESKNHKICNRKVIFKSLLRIMELIK